MNCDQAFDALTSRGASSNEALNQHLEACPRCRDMADVLSPALELFAPAAFEEAAATAGEFADSPALPTAGSPHVSGADWIDTAPWRNNVRSARRARRDGLKIVGAVVLVAVLTVAFAKIGRDTPQSGFVSPLAAAECIRESTEPMPSEQAVAACVSCHLQLTTKQLEQPARIKSQKTILSCVDCHMGGTDEPTGVHLAWTEVACLFRSTGG
jgi:hypothetical protein